MNVSQPLRWGREGRSLSYIGRRGHVYRTVHLLGSGLFLNKKASRVLSFFHWYKFSFAVILLISPPPPPFSSYPSSLLHLFPLLHFCLRLKIHDGKLTEDSRALKKLLGSILWLFPQLLPPHPLGSHSYQVSAFVLLTIMPVSL